MTAELLNGITLLLAMSYAIGYHFKVSRKLFDGIKRVENNNVELLKRIPVTKEGETCMAPLTVEMIAEAVRFEGYVPEVGENWVNFKVQGESYYIDANRLPMLFLIKSYAVDPKEWEMDLLREAAHRMSDELVMVKATFSDDSKGMRFFVAASDRNYDSFRGNLTSYLSILEDGQRIMNEAYNKMVDEKREAAMKATSVIPSAKQENKMLS